MLDFLLLLLCALPVIVIGFLLSVEDLNYHYRNDHTTLARKEREYLQAQAAAYKLKRDGE